MDNGGAISEKKTSVPGAKPVAVMPVTATSSGAGPLPPPLPPSHGTPSTAPVGNAGVPPHLTSSSASKPLPPSSANPHNLPTTNTTSPNAAIPRLPPPGGFQPSDEGFQPKIPVLRLALKKKPAEVVDDGTESVTVEKQDASKNDSYCWVCHEGGEVLCCDRCPRVFHVKCTGLGTEPEGDGDWFCPVCKSISRKSKRSKPHNLKDLLLLAVKRMMFSGTEIFQKDVPSDIVSHYREYIFFPMHLGKIRKKVEAGKFQNTREFIHETEWILHNCIIYNGAKHALTKIAKNIIKVCKEDMREIELCPSCYSLTVKQPYDWFCIPCNPPHRVVLAKVRGYPLWPAKLISETSDKCDVRFFGQHDRSLVPKSSIQKFTWPPPTPTTKTTHWTAAIEEFHKYEQNINQMLHQIKTGKTPEQYIAEKIESAPKHPPVKENPAPKFPRIPKKVSAEKNVATTGRSTQPQSHPPISNGYMSESIQRSREVSLPPGLTASNHIPASPQIVEIKIHGMYSESEDSGSIHGNSAQLMAPDSQSEPSSPGSDGGGLQIDMPEGDGDHSRSRIAPSANKFLLKSGGRRTSHMPPDMHLDNSQMADSMNNSVTPTSFRQSRGRPGDVLSAITHSLAERKAAEMRGQHDVTSTPLSRPNFSERNVDTLFSPAYPPDKVAIAVVDPDQKRRKRKFVGVSPVKKSKRRMNKNNEPQLPQYETTAGIITGAGEENAEALAQLCARNYPTIDSATDTQGTSSDPLPAEIPLRVEEGLLGDTMRVVDQSLHSRLDAMVGPTDDMGFQYFTEKLMSSMKAVVYEMLSTFEHKGKMGAKQIKEHLHTAWPVPDSRSQLERLRLELRNEMRQALEVVRRSAELERQQVVSEVRRQADVEKDLAILETKKKKWCTYCLKEAQYNCCWNANYCNESCQMAHWPEHMNVCTQAQQQPQQPHMPPPPPGIVPHTPAEVQHILSPSAQVPDGSAFVFNGMAASSAQVQMGEGLATEENARMVLESECSAIPMLQSRVGSGPIEAQALMSVPLSPQHMVLPGNVPAVQATITPMEEPMGTSEQSVVIEQIPNHALLHQSMSPPSILLPHSMDQNPTLPSVTLPPSSPPSHSSSLANINLHAQPISPASPPHHPEPHTLVSSNGAGFSWPYQQPVGSIAADFNQALPLLPQVPAPTPTTQPGTFFRVF